VDIVVYSLILPSSVFGVVHEESLAGFLLRTALLQTALGVRKNYKVHADLRVSRRASRTFEKMPRRHAENGTPEKS